VTTKAHSSILRRIKTLKDPASYYVGTPSVSTALPENILMMGRYSERPASMQDRVHHRFLLAINLGGEGDVIVDGRRHRLGVGQCFLIFPHQWHHFFYDIKTIQWILITFELRPSEPLESLRNHTVVLSDEAMRFLDILTEFYPRVKRFDPPNAQKVMLLTQLLLNELARSERFLNLPPSESLVDKVNRFLTANLSRPLRIAEIAEHFAYSPSRFRTIYREAMGISIGRYIKEIKLNKAQSLLGTTDMTINEIAAECGYDSVYSFSHAFKNYTQRSPSTYRKNLLPSNTK
jgi:AraC-like DNA-binding protein